ncbi:MAG: ATP-binding cassette domain-containing protein, partial [Aestuariivirgaceae bacterium]
LVLRSGKLVAERDASKTSQAELADLMVGRPVAEPKRQPQDPGSVIAELAGVSVMREGKLLLDGIDMQLRSGEILGLAGVSGNGQNALAGMLAGLYPPSAGTLVLDGRLAAHLSPRAAVRRGVARIPEDRHSHGLIADMSVAENVIAERYSEPPFSRRGLLDWDAARRFSEEIIHAYEVRCPSPQSPVRLLSGGNMQKLLLGRVLSGNPRLIIANQPTRGLDIGAVAYVHGRLLAARAAGAAILLISEDLDEIMSLADRIAVAYRGRISAPLVRAAADIRTIGLMMSGHGFDSAGSEPGHAA